MGKVKKIKYFTNEKKALISKENRKLYDKYLNSSIIKNRDVKDTTYKVYKNYVDQFLVYLAENHDNVGLYDEEYLENAVDIMEGYISFLQETLENNKKVINTKLSAVSSFYLWSMKRGYVSMHPFDKKLDRMKGASEEQIISHYYLEEEQVNFITEELKDNPKFDIQDKLLWSIMMDSANRVGAISKLTISSLDLDNMLFSGIREKRGYRVEVPFMEETKVLIEEWMEKRKELDKLEVDSLFITKYAGEFRAMSVSSIQERIKKIGKILDIDDFHAHCVRKTKLNLVYTQTGDLSLAAALGNHKSVETTRQAYIKPQSKAEIRERILKMMQRNKDADSKKE